MAPTPRPAALTTRSGAVMALGSMTLVQLGIAAAVGQFDRVGVEGAAWLRLAFGGLILLVILRPWRASVRPTRRGLAGGCALGVVTAGLTVLFMAAVSRLPLGTASALEFLGPLGVAAVRSRDRRGLAWPLLAAAGVLALTEPWRGEVDLLGVAFALGAAACWAAYIVLTQLVGDELDGVQGLAISLPVAGVTATLALGPFVLGGGSTVEWGWDLVPIGIGLALLVPVLPFALEMLALRRLTVAAFGTLMALEPAIATAIGAVVLLQVPGPWQLVGVALVVVAGVGAERTGARTPDDPSVERPDHDQGAAHASMAVS